MQTDTDLVLDESILDDDPQCQATHHWEGTVACSQIATHALHVRCLQRSGLVCTAWTNEYHRVCANTRQVCFTCGERIEADWIPIPI